MSDSKEDVKAQTSDNVGTGLLPIESGPGETNDMKTQERASEVKPANGEGGESELERELMRELAAADNEIEAATQAKKEEENGKMTAMLKESDSDREEKVVKDAVKQITFYLSDSNLPYDKFLFTQSMKDKEDSAPMGTGWIPLSTILSFKRMQEITSQSSRSATICEFAIVNALRASYPSSDANGLLEISENGEQIRRKKELVPPSQTGQIDRSVYVKGFPEETEDDKKSSGRGGKSYSFSPLQKQLEAWFESLGCGRVNAVRMRRDEHKKFKQSVFVEFATAESAKNFLDLDPKPTYTGQEKPVESMAKKAYVDMKAKEKGITMPEYAENKQGSTREHGGRDNRPFNAFRDWHARNGGGGGYSDRAPREVKVFVEGKELEVDQETGRVKNQDEITYQSGKVARFEGAGDSDEANPMTLKTSLLGIHPTVFVDYERGSASGVVLFKEKVTEEKLKEIQDADLEMAGGKLTWNLLEGEDEKKYHIDRANKRASIALADAKSGGRDRNDRSRGGGRGGGRGGDRGRGGRGRGRGGNDRRGGRNDRPNDRNEERNERKRDRDDDASTAEDKPKATPIGTPDAPPAAKKAKTEE